MVLRKGCIHKDNHITDKQVGWWRHRNYLLCTGFSTAANVIWDLANDHRIHFFHYDKTKRCPWWDKPFIGYNDYDAQKNAQEQIYRATGVSTCKVTHLRTLAVQHAGSEGLAPWQINTMTKHMLEKINSAYQSEVDKTTMKVMAGFSVKESYFVPRTLIGLPYSAESLCTMLLPRLADWRAEADSCIGDKSTCCSKFLHEILPFLVEILVQDGIYLIKDFPNHVMSRFLKVQYSKLHSDLVSVFLQSTNYFFYSTFYDFVH